MNLVFNPSIYTVWNEVQLKKNKPVPLYWSTAEAFYSEDFNLAQLFKLPYKVITNIIYNLSKDVHISYTDFNKMPFFEILMIVDAHNEFIEKQEQSNGDQNDMIAQQQAQMESTFRNQQQSMPKYQQPQMPQMPSFNFPK